MRHHIIGLLDWECTVCLCPIKSSLELIVPYILRMLNENEKLEKSTCTTKNPASCNKCTIFKMGAEFARGRVCSGPSLSGARDVRESFKQLGTLFFALDDCNHHAMTAPFEYRGSLACFMFASSK